MSLIPWFDRRPATPRASALAQMFDHFFDEPFASKLPEVFTRSKLPACNVSEDDKNYTVAFELPGMTEKEIQVEVRENTLNVSGERKFENEKKEQDFHLVESQYGSFSRAVALPAYVRTATPTATYAKGMLSVSFAKVEPTPSARIEVKAR
ncbi:MAG: Hsp20/alpha crystallin family protein [Planctomycetota bacterium]